VEKIQLTVEKVQLTVEKVQLTVENTLICKKFNIEIKWRISFWIKRKHSEFQDYHKKYES
jgi:hypothetical protein